MKKKELKDKIVNLESRIILLEAELKAFKTIFSRPLPPIYGPGCDPIVTPLPYVGPGCLVCGKYHQPGLPCPQMQTRS